MMTFVHQSIIFRLQPCAFRFHSARLCLKSDALASLWRALRLSMTPKPLKPLTASLYDEVSVAVALQDWLTARRVLPWRFEYILGQMARLQEDGAF